MSEIHVHDASDLRKYRTELPNLVYDMGLSPHAGWLYGHLKRTCGSGVGGKCWKSTRTLATEANMSAGKVSEARQELEDANLIRVERPSDKTKPIVVTITDIWPKNFTHFSRESDAPRVQNMNASRSEYETKKEPLEEFPFKGEAKASSDTFVAFLADELEGADVPLTRTRRERYGREFKQLISRDVSEGVLYKVCDRIVERWVDDNHHHKLLAEHALGDVLNGNVPGHVSDSATKGSTPMSWKERKEEEERLEAKRKYDAKYPTYATKSDGSWGVAE